MTQDELPAWVEPCYWVVVCLVAPPFLFTGVIWMVRFWVWLGGKLL